MNEIATNWRLGKTNEVFLDCLRSLASLAVLVGHWRNLFFMDAHERSPVSLLQNAFYFLTGFSHDAVMVFFVLSGLLVSYGVFFSFARREWSWRRYLTQRLSRLMIVLIPALMLGFFWDSLGMHLFGNAQIYGGDQLGGNVITWDVKARSGMLTYLGNLAFLQMIKVTTPGSNGPLWSLSFEFWYYILFPLLLLVVSPFAKPVTRLMYGLVGLGLFLFLPEYISSEFGIWLLGVAIIYAYIHKKIPSTISRLAGWGYVIFFVTLGLGRRYHFAANDYLVGFVTAILVLCILSRQADQKTVYSNGVIASLSKTFSRFSFSLYVTHLPMLVFLRACLVHGKRWTPDFFHVAAGSGILFGALIQAYAFSLITENQTGKLRRLLNSGEANASSIPQRAHSASDDTSMGMAS